MRDSPRGEHHAATHDFRLLLVSNPRGRERLVKVGDDRQRHRRTKHQAAKTARRHGSRENSRYPYPRGRDHGYVDGRPRAGEGPDNTCTQGTESSRIVIQPMPGELTGEYPPRRGSETAQTGTGENSRRTTASSPKPNLTNHRMMIINKSIIVLAPYIGWLLLPNTTLAKKRSIYCSSTSAASSAHRRHSFTVQSNLIRVMRNCNYGLVSRSEINLEMDVGYGDGVGKLG